MGERMLRPIVPATDVLEKWSKAKSTSVFDHITSRDIKRLSSEPLVVFDEAFISLIVSRNERLSRASLKMIV